MHRRQTNLTITPIRARGGGLRRNAHTRNNASTTDNPRMMTSPPRDKDSDTGANNDADDDAERGAKPRAAKKADEYSTRRVRTATTPHDSNDDSDDSADKAAKPGATDKADKATRDCTRCVRAAIACKSVMAT
jgi:hypothetical protein